MKIMSVGGGGCMTVRGSREKFFFLSVGMG